MTLRNGHQIDIHSAFGICHRNSSIMGRPFLSSAFSIRPQIPSLDEWLMEEWTRQ